jgi:hypothetical protein
MNIIEAIKDDQLFRPFLADRDDRLSTWFNWFAALRTIYGLRVNKERRDLVRRCTGRDPERMPSEGFSTALFLTGRRSGKSRMAACIAAFEAVLAGHEGKLAPGEAGFVAICSPTKSQSRVCKGYLRSIFETPLLANEVSGETRQGFSLRNGTQIEILAGDFRTVRGFTLIAAVIDEIAFFGLEAESKIKSDTELVRAIKPSLATVGGKLIAITSPYAKRGWCYKQYQNNHGNDSGKTLVWNCASRTMNETLDQSIVDDALAEDLAAAKSEYYGEWRDDVSEFLSRTVIEGLVVKGRKALLPRTELRYSAFCDVSGGRRDDATLAIGHRRERTVIVDLLRRWRPPFSPQAVISDMAEEMRRYGVRKITGDNYAAEFVARAFQSCGIHYVKADKPKAQLYGELLPRLCSGEIELPDDEALVNQLASLERRTRSGGRDVIDHPPGGHDDLANAVAGIADVLGSRRMVGAF